MKKNMNSLLYVRKLCITTMRNLKSGLGNTGEMFSMVINFLVTSILLQTLLLFLQKYSVSQFYNTSFFN